MGSFLSSLLSNIERVQEEVNTKIISYVASPLFTRIVQNSPSVGNGLTADGPYVTGCFANNWFPAVNGYDTSVSLSVASMGADSLARIGTLVTAKPFFQKDGFISLSNNLRYAYRVEWAGWPAGKDPVSGWTWTGRRIPYAPVANSLNWIKTQL